MVRALSAHLKAQIYDHVLRQRNSAEAISQALFGGNQALCSLVHLRRLSHFLRSALPDDAVHWRDSVPTRSGRPQRLSQRTAAHVETIMTAAANTRLKSLRKIINDDLFGVDAAAEGFSYATIRRTLERLGYTRKVLERRHILRNEELRLAYFGRIESFPPGLLVDIDEMGARPENYFERHGWAPRGMDAVVTQLAIGGHTYNVLAAYTPGGFLTWKIFVDETVDAPKFIDWLHGELQPVLRHNAFCIIDNARLHKTPASLAALEAVFNGLYAFCAPYSPLDKPIEKGFANIKNFLREHEAEAVLNPMLWIRRAFDLYSIVGERGHVARGHFNPYFRNHDFYLGN